MIVFGHGIHYTNELSHHCNQCNHLTFSPAEQIVVVSSQYRIMPNRYKSRHEQSATDFFATSAGHAFAAKDPAVTCNRCNSNQRGDLSAVEPSQFRQLRYQHVSCSRANPGNRVEDFRASPKSGRIFDVFGNLPINGFQLGFNDFQNSSDAASNLPAAGVFKAVGFGGMKPYQLIPTGYQSLEFLRVFIDLFGRHWFHRGCKLGYYTSIQLVGFGDLPCGPGEVPYASGIDYGHSKPFGLKRGAAKASS